MTEHETSEDQILFRRLLTRTLVLPLVLLALLSGVFAAQNLIQRDLNHTIDRTDRAIGQAYHLQKLFLDAETGLRGFLLNGQETFLEPYDESEHEVGAAFARLRFLVDGDVEQTARIQDIERRFDEWTKISIPRIAHQRAGEPPSILESQQGKAAMDGIRGLVAQVIVTEEDLRTQRTRVAETAIVASLAGGALLALAVGALIAWAGRRQLVSLAGRYNQALAVQEKQTEALRQEEWLTRGQAELDDEMRGEPTEDQLATRIVGFLARHLGAVVGVCYLVDERGGTLHRRAGFALTEADAGGPPATVALGESWIGQVAVDRRVVTLADVPDDHVRLASGTGASRPRHLLLAPLTAGAGVVGVVELGFVDPPRARAEEYLGLVGESAGVALRSARYRMHLQTLLAETQRQAQELQTRQEELRVSNEELEEQSRALQRSQAQMETQQEELEASNVQLEEQTQALEDHRDRLEAAQVTLADRAEQLARASQYKSEFLANMSHELRTPLNSTLILAKLLADNKDGTLTAEQVKFAHTIHASGQDLLALINDILDLSRIEAGQLSLAVESVAIARTVDALVQTFQPIATQKGLVFATHVDPAVPATIDTDPQRLVQILRNLLSNAFKFTAEGSVELRVTTAGADRVAFAVRDTGIGIAADQQQAVFDAFRQADGSTHRKYGGTGLGLAISRDLARNLGGDVDVTSTVGQGSVFTLVLPLTATTTLPVARPTVVPRPSPRPSAPPPAPVLDDRDDLPPGKRIILLVEDDVRFAEILTGIVHERGFRCLHATNGTDGLELARRHQPSGIVLDVNLPDVSGLVVLERLKRDATTRHIPTHVVSVVDASQRALELGAVGYALKPIGPEELEEALGKLQEKFEQTTGRVLVVEDAEPQRESIRRLLESDVVAVTTVGTAAEALEALRTTTFDCMVLDLGLPDMSGFELLERISSDQRFAFPPVIVYTARDLSSDEELKLRRYSRSVVIKGARSPERLLDEVTLFLHRLESTLSREQQRLLRAVRDREAAFEGRTILLAEDDVRNIFALSSALEPRGARMVIARNGREALAALDDATRDGRCDVDVVLMDVMMPEMDGLTATREIRKRPEWRKLPVIAITAKAMADDREQCLDAGANDYVAKPIDVDKLLSLLRVWMVPR